jgi:hypothetical protein
LLSSAKAGRQLRAGRKAAQSAGRDEVPILRRFESWIAHLRHLKGTTDIGDGPFHEGQPVWVIQSDGSQRAAEYVGGGETSAWFGGAPTVFVAYPDTRSGEAVEVDRVIPRDV